jgi:hypothetical protein
VKHRIPEIKWVSLHDGSPYVGRIVWAYGIVVELKGEQAVLVKATRKGFKVLSHEEWEGVIMHDPHAWAPYESPREAPHEE